MQQYADHDNKSGVKAYENGSDYIIVEFKSGRETFYKYTYGSAGSSAIEHMKLLANQGRGLNTYISSKETQPPFAKKGVTLGSVR